MVKRIEHFWKGLSANRTQISPIPPQAYGERFINFITGTTMTREEAERRKTEESRRSGVQAPGLSMESQRPLPEDGQGTIRDSSMQSPPMSPAVEKTMRKAQKQTDKSTSSEKGRRGSEEEKPDRILRTTEEPRGTFLPVVSEAGENGEQSEKRALSPPDESPEYQHRLSASPAPMDRSVPGLRKVSPSTVDTATDMADDTSVSSAQGVDFAPVLQAETAKQDGSVNAYQKPPRIASDLIQPQSPFSESLMKSMHEHLGPDP